MMHTLVGREGFRARHRPVLPAPRRPGGDVRRLRAGDRRRQSGQRLAEHLDAFKRWYVQAGTPTLLVHGHHDADARTYTLRLGQRCACRRPTRASKLPFVIPGGAVACCARRHAPCRALQGEPMAGGTSRVLVLSTRAMVFTFVDIDAEPVPSLPRGFSHLCSSTMRSPMPTCACC